MASGATGAIAIKVLAANTFSLKPNESMSVLLRSFRYPDYGAACRQRSLVKHITTDPAGNLTFAGCTGDGAVECKVGCDEAFGQVRRRRIADLDGFDRIVVVEDTAIPTIAAIYARAPLDTLKAWQAFHLAGCWVRIHADGSYV
jgi:hypothetical protein